MDAGVGADRVFGRRMVTGKIAAGVVVAKDAVAKDVVAKDEIECVQSVLNPLKTLACDRLTTQKSNAVATRSSKSALPDSVAATYTRSLAAKAAWMWERRWGTNSLGT